jgi:hypothetical protein
MPERLLFESPRGGLFDRENKVDLLISYALRGLDGAFLEISCAVPTHGNELVPLSGMMENRKKEAFRDRPVWLCTTAPGLHRGVAGRQWSLHKRSVP